MVGCGRRAEKEGKRGREKTYKGRTRTLIRVGSERGMRAEARSLGGGVTAFDAELSALVRGIELCYLQASPRVAFNIFTNSQAAIIRLQDDRPGPSQKTASRGIVFAKGAYRKGASISVNWVPGHAGVLGNEVADQWAVDAATREMRASKGKEDGRGIIHADRTVSRAPSSQYSEREQSVPGGRRSGEKDREGDRTRFRRKTRFPGSPGRYRGRTRSWHHVFSSLRLDML